MKKILIIICLFMSTIVYAQGGGVQRTINMSPDNELVLDIFSSSVTVVDKEFTDAVLYGAVISDLFEQAIQDGRAFRARTYFQLDSGETRFFYGETSGNTVEVHFRVIVPHTDGRTKYTVYLEPDVSSGTSIRSGGFNPHMQVIGGYTPTYSGIYYNPSSVTSFGTLIPDATEKWGQGYKIGGTSGSDFKTILSPNQGLGFMFQSYINGNGIRVEFVWYEVPGGIEE